MSRIAIIPARGGSKRIPRKNVKEFCGKPILAYSIEAALNSNLFDEVMVSTDDNGIAKIAKRYGASVPFLRSAETANDFAILKDVLNEVLAKYKELEKSFDEVCCILPTAPLVETVDIIKSHEILEREKCVSVVPVVKYSYTIFRSLKIENGRLAMNWPENFPKRSQDLPDAYHDAGLFYWYSKKYFEEKIAGFGENACPYILEEEKVQDIDTLDDWKMAEIKYSILNNDGDTNMNRKEFYIYRYNLLQSFFSGNLTVGKNFITNEEAYSYAWSCEIYPLFDACYADEEFEGDFRVKKDYVQKVANLIDEIVTDFDVGKICSYPNYYDIQKRLGGKSENLDLPYVLRYIFLTKKI